MSGKEDDLFGLGALLFFVTTGRRPPRANQSGNVALPDLGNYPDLGLDIISLITRLLLPRLARLSTTRELLAALEHSNFSQLCENLRSLEDVEKDFYTFRKPSISTEKL